MGQVVSEELVSREVTEGEEEEAKFVLNEIVEEDSCFFIYCFLIFLIWFLLFFPC